MGTVAEKGSGRGRTVARSAAPPLAVVSVLALMSLAGLMGIQPASSRTMASPPRPAALDYRRDPAGRIAPVRSQFIVDRLGLSFAAHTLSIGGLSSGDGVAPRPLGADGGPAPSALTARKSFRCVGGRQTEDPLAPPCDDSDFTGDNGGATWRGVSREEVRVLVRIRGGDPFAPPAPVRSGPEAGASPADRYIDLGAPPTGEDPIVVAPLRDLQTYFNRRYQTFGRRVRLIVYFDDGYARAGADERELAAENDLIAASFSGISLIRDLPFVDAYVDELARRGVVAFDGVQFRSQQFFDRRPGHLWGYHATAEQQAALFASYVCEKVVGHPVSISGEPLAQGKPRRIALLRTSNPSQLGYLELGRRVREQVKACGGEIVDEARYRTNGEQCTNLPHEQDDEDIRRAADDLTRFRAKGVTTILWPGCPTSAHPIAASAEGWLPEWVVIGDPYMSQAALAGTFAGAVAVWDRHAVMVSARPYQPPVWLTRCWAALQEVDPAEDEVSGRLTVCDWFGSLQQVFAGIQLAGPRLTPDTLTAGFRRLRVEASTDPQVPTCSYEPGDSACIKDAQALFFDMRGGADEYAPGPVIESSLPYAPAACWRAIEHGKRSLPGAWPPGNVDAQVRADDPCTYDQQHVVREGFTVGRM